MLVVFILSSLLFLKLCLVLFSILNNSLSNVLNSDIAGDIILFEDAKFLRHLVGIDVAVFFEDMVLISFRMNDFSNVQTLDLVLRDLIVASDHHIVDVLAGEDHENALVEREDWILASLEEVHNIISPDSNIEEISLGLGLLQSLDMAVMKEVKTSLDIDHFICGLRLTVVTEMHDSSSCC